MKSNKLTTNYIFNLSYQILTIILPFIMTPYVSRVLGVEGIGVYNYSYSIVSSFTMIAVLGTNSYAIREIACRQNDKKANSQFFFEIIILRLICMMTVLPIYLIISFNSGKYQTAFLIMTINLLTVLFDISWLFQGVENFKLTVVRNFIVKIVGVILILAFVKKSSDLTLYIFIMSGITLLGQISMWKYLSVYVSKKELNKLNIRQHIRPSISFFIPQASAYIYTNVDKILLGILGTEILVGYYSQSEKIVKMAMTVITSLGVVMLPRMSYLLQQKEYAEAKNKINTSIRFTTIIGMPMMFGVSATASHFIPWFLGDGYEECISLLQILSPLILIVGLASTTGLAILVPMGKQKEYNISIISGAIVNLIFNILFIPKYGVFGASIATIIAELTVTVLQIKYSKTLLDIRAIIQENYKYLLSSCIMFMFLLKIKAYLEFNFISTVILVTIGGFIYFLSLIILRDSLVFKGINIFKKKVLKR